jgi:serine/threonine protein kinase
MMRNNNTIMPGPGMTINNRFRLNEKIYKGGFGEIMKAKDLHNGEEVVVKIVSTLSAN